MRLFCVLTAFVSLVGCQSTCCKHTAHKPKWALESGLATSVYPNAPYDKHDYLIEKIDVSIKLRKEW